MESNNTNSRQPHFKIFKIFIIGVYFLSISLVAVYAFRHPHYNWDMLPYMSLALKPNKINIDSIHAFTYRSAKENIPEKDYSNLISGNKRESRAKNSKAYYDLLPLYAVKPLYILSVRLFYEWGASLPMATILPSVLSYLLMGGLILFWLTKYLKLIWSVFVSLLIMFSGFMVFAARLSTPDFLSALFLLSALYFIVTKPSITGVIIFLLLSIATRLDNIIPAIFILTFLFFSGKSPMKIKLPSYLGLSVLLIASYFVFNSIALKGFEWNVFYYTSFSKYLNVSGTYNSSFSFKEYAALCSSQFFSALLYSSFFIFQLILLLVLYSRRFSFRNLSLEQQLSLLCLFIILTRFFLYPDLADRFNLSYYLFFLLILVKRYASHV